MKKADIDYDYMRELPNLRKVYAYLKRIGISEKEIDALKEKVLSIRKTKDPETGEHGSFTVERLCNLIINWDISEVSRVEVAKEKAARKPQRVGREWYEIKNLALTKGFPKKYDTPDEFATFSPKHEIDQWKARLT